MVHRLAVLASGLVLFSLVHSVLAADTVRDWALRRGTGNPHRYRMLYNLVAVTLLAGTWIATPGDYAVIWRAHGWVRIMMLTVQALALVGFVLTVRRFDAGEFLGFTGFAVRPAASSSPRERLDTGGTYRLCRHPLYFFTSLFFSAWPTMDLRSAVIALWLWTYSVLGSILEERKLVRKFGDAYRAYQATHPRLLPLGRRRWPGHQA